MSTKMRVLIASANERDGGAAIAASRLRDGLLAADHFAGMFVQTPGPKNPSTISPTGSLQRTFARVRSDIDGLPLLRYPNRHAPFAANWLPRFYPSWPVEWGADIVHLHWINAGFINLGDIQSLKVPIVWTMHDMWALTGGCNYDEECGRYVSGCGNCPILHSTNEMDLSRRRWRAKRTAYKAADLTIVSPSKWLAECVERSPLLAGRPLRVIRNGLDLDRYKPLDRGFARRALGLPQDKKVILFGAMNASSDPRKGNDLLELAMRRLSSGELGQSTVLAIFGSPPQRRETTFGFPTIHFGALGDDIALALLYAAADVFVAPSRQDNLPNTVAEALACGTPCVSFNIGGMPDMIVHRENGYLARPFDAEELAAGIEWVIRADDDLAGKLRGSARLFAEKHLDLKKQTRMHVDLYQELLGRRGTAHD